MNQKNPAIKRILADVRELEKHPSSRYQAAPLEENMFEWHFTIRGPTGTDFEGGIYHGRILLPPDYPFKPPNIVFLTKNGRFEVGTKICLSISAYHEETWQPAWGVRTMLEAIISFMPSEGNGAIGALDWSAAERKRLATESHRYHCPLCGSTSALLKHTPSITGEGGEEEKISPEIAAQISQLQLNTPGHIQSMKESPNKLTSPSKPASNNIDNTTNSPLIHVSSDQTSTQNKDTTTTSDDNMKSSEYRNLVDEYISDSHTPSNNNDNNNNNNNSSTICEEDMKVNNTLTDTNTTMKIPQNTISTTHNVNQSPQYSDTYDNDNSNNSNNNDVQIRINTGLRHRFHSTEHYYTQSQSLSPSQLNQETSELQEVPSTPYHPHYVKSSSSSSSSTMIQDTTVTSSSSSSSTSQPHSQPHLNTAATQDTPPPSGMINTNNYTDTNTTLPPPPMIDDYDEYDPMDSTLRAILAILSLFIFYLMYKQMELILHPTMRRYF